MDETDNEDLKHEEIEIHTHKEELTVGAAGVFEHDWLILLKLVGR